MKKIIGVIILVLLSMSVQAQWVVSNPVSDAANTTIASQATIQAQMKSMEMIAKTTSTVVTSLTSVKDIIATINAISCTAADFNFYVGLAYEMPFWNCWLSNEVNMLVNQANAIVDVVNTILTATVLAEPADRLQLIKGAIDRYVQLEVNMRQTSSYLHKRIHQQKVASNKHRMAREISGITIQGRDLF